jgi:hypothetical protein
VACYSKYRLPVESSRSNDTSQMTASKYTKEEQLDLTCRPQMSLLLFPKKEHTVLIKEEEKRIMLKKSRRASRL